MRQNILALYCRIGLSITKGKLRLVNMDSFIVAFWARVFSALRWVSWFQLITSAVPRLRTFVFVELWVLGNLLASFLSIFIARYAYVSMLWIGVLIYSSIRVFEIIIYQINVLLFEPRPKS